MTEKPPFFSIITVTKDNVTGLKSTQNSLKIQKSKDFEWIIIDGASRDDTPSHLKTLKNQWISEPDNGIYDAMNKGIDRASGQYLLFLNAGDILPAPETLQNLKSTIKDQDFIYGDALERDKNGHTHTKPARNHKTIARGLFTHHQAMIYKRATIGDLRYDTHYKIAADYDFTLKFLKKTDTTLYCPTPLCIFQSGGISQTKADLGRREQYQIRKKSGDISPLTNMIITAAQWAAWRFRTLCPALYWRLKSSGSNAGGTAQKPTPQGHPKTPA